MPVIIRPPVEERGDDVTEEHHRRKVEYIYLLYHFLNTHPCKIIFRPEKISDQSGTDVTHVTSSSLLEVFQHLHIIRRKLLCNELLFHPKVI
ncbi:MAG: hypothetical protein GXY48_14685 [Methanomicrobiales archaeon]|nr:hypothetical protein [Methanomicrobiales archaeon]